MPRIGAFRPASRTLAGFFCALVLLVPVAAYAAAPHTLMTLVGAAAGDNLGRSVGRAGDFNGDGFDDVIVGAPNSDATGADAGAAYIYFGGPAADAVADLTLRGAAAGDYFGSSVSGAGDVNHDGFDDVIVGAYGNDAGGLAAGRAYVYFGGYTPDTVADLTLTGVAASDWFGFSVGTAGDVNHDGYGDVIVGAYGNDAGGAAAGRAYVFYGGTSPDATPDLTLTGAAASDWFGYAVGAAGDVNGDGYGDVVVGAYYNDAGGTNAGRAYVYYGGSAPDAVADLTFTGAAAGDFFGRAVGAAGDVNGDGYDDVLVGAYLNDAAGTDAGRAYLFFGGASTDQTPDVIYSGEAAGNYFGYALGTLGDLNGDGYAEVVVGAYRNGAGGTDAGRAYVYYGAAAPDAVADVTLTGAAAGDAYGVAGGSAGDVNGDGHPDLIVAATGNDAGGSNAGVAYVYDSGSPQTAAYRRALTMAGEFTNGVFGSAVSTAGDMNGDGYADFIVADEQGGADNSYQGAASIFFGGPAVDAVADLTLWGEAAGDWLGGSVSRAGDVNGDGFDDVIVGAPNSDAGGTSAGRAYVYFGGASPDAVPDWVLTGTAHDMLGVGVGAAGDVNGDGYDDVIVGLYGSEPYFKPGRACVYFGGPSPDAVADLTFTSPTLDDRFGLRVDGAGDVNADGYPDLIVGAWGNDAGGTDAGRAYVYYGGPGADAVADLVMTGEAAGDGFGISAGAAGDVDGDGYDDFLVGAAWNDAGGTDAGRVYVYRGGPGVDAVPDLVLTGNVAAVGHIGASAAAAGDLNGDGYGDLVISGQDDRSLGQVHVFYGAAVLDAVEDRVLRSGTPSLFFGHPVAAAGDVRGDGFPDLVIGAPDYTPAGPGRGIAYLYDVNRHLVTYPDGGEIWNIGWGYSAAWLGSERADVWLSLDGGNSYDLVARAAGGADSNVVYVFAPLVETLQALVKVTPSEPWLTGSDTSDSVFTIRDPIAVEEIAGGRLRLRAPWPNPARGSVRLAIELPTASEVSLRVFDVRGRQVAEPIAGERLPAGVTAREWRPVERLAAGVYTLRAVVGATELTRRLVWLGTQ